MKVALGADHGGFALKEAIRGWLEQAGHEVLDFGTHSEEACDYPDLARPAAEAVARGEAERAILVCGTGIGMSIVANKVAGVRAALCHDAYTARLSREHNDANVLCLGGRVLGPGVAREMVEIWLATPFAGGRHARRVAKVEALDGEREAAR
ncbi:MAG: ribose 5-phosphate isomerase B [Clostridia bacterium]|nr:ribose 5-phosphate isomerase B [Clostridia bacterium]MCL6521089.1 ribose 5-phosphate isomerase B [Bacillota bacterium]